MTVVAFQESKDEEMKEVANEMSEKAQQMKDETFNEIKGKERKDEEVKVGKEAFDSQVPEVEMEEKVPSIASEKGGEIIHGNKAPGSQELEEEMEASENVTVKLVETDSVVTKSQLASIEPPENSRDAEMGEADLQLKQSVPVL
ncbi:hypothetical protein X975_19564, partial [Stegodyphus mimosarum]